MELTIIQQEAIAAGQTSFLLGAAGTGKTSLAVRAAHLLEARFPDGQLLIELEGSTPPLQRLLKDLGVAAEHLPEDANGQVRLYRSLLAGRRLLLVLDGASTEEEVRTLAADLPGCLTIVTSRRRLAGLTGATWIRLGGLTEEETAEAMGVTSRTIQRDWAKARAWLHKELDSAGAGDSQ